jgi:hypothetical protein
VLAEVGDQLVVGAALVGEHRDAAVDLEAGK